MTSYSIVKLHMHCIKVDRIIPFPSSSSSLEATINIIRTIIIMMMMMMMMMMMKILTEMKNRCALVVISFY